MPLSTVLHVGRVGSLIGLTPSDVVGVVDLATPILTPAGSGSRWAASDPVTHGEDISPSNVGTFPGITLTAYSGPTIITVNGTTIEDKIVNADLTIRAQNVTIRNCQINGYIDIDEGSSDFQYSFYAVDCDINAGNRAVTTVGSKNFRVERCEIRGGNRSVYPYHYGEVVENYIWDQWVSATVRTHASAIRQSQNGLILRNNFRCDVEDIDPPGSGASANLTGYGDFETVQFNTIESNYIGWTHGGYGAYFGSSASKPFPNANNIRVIDNIWERGPSGINATYGPNTDYNPSAPGNVWINNRWDDGTIQNPA